MQLVPLRVGAFVLSALGIVYVQEAERKIPMQYSTRWGCVQVDGAVQVAFSLPIALLPGFNPCTYKVKTWFQAFAFKCNLYRYNAIPGGRLGEEQLPALQGEQRGRDAHHLRVLPARAARHARALRPQRHPHRRRQGGAVQVVNAVDPCFEAKGSIGAISHENSSRYTATRLLISWFQSLLFRMQLVPLRRGCVPRGRGVRPGEHRAHLLLQLLLHLPAARAQSGAGCTSCLHTLYTHVVCTSCLHKLSAQVVCTGFNPS
jgi:hypothetical protein